MKKVIGTLLAVLVSTTLLVAVTPPTQADAANSALFDPGNIISDAAFFDGQAMSASTVQNFLNEQVTSCRSGYTCLKDYRQNTPSKVAITGRCAAYAGRSGESAAQIITNVGNACGISQKAMLVLLEKEQGIVTSSAPSSRMYRSATGYGCPDTADCDSLYYGFFNQVYSAALQFQYYAANPTRWNHIPGRVNAVRFHPNAACGSSEVFIQNQATAGLYNYTPYQPNARAIANMYGSGDACSSYGNRNFWRMYTDWFGAATTGTSLMRSNSDSTVYLVSGKLKHPITSMGILSALSPLGTLGYVSQSYLDRFTTAHPVGRSIRSNDGTIYFFDSGRKLPFSSCEQAADYAASCAPNGFVQLTDPQMQSFETGPMLTSVLGTVEGSRYYIKGGRKAEILDAQSQQAAGIGSAMNVLSENAVASLAMTTPIVRDGAFALSRSTGSSFLLSAGKRFPVIRGSEDRLGVTTRTSGMLVSESLLQIPAGSNFTGMVSAAGTGPLTAVYSEGRHQITAGGVGAAQTPVSQALIDSYPALTGINAGSFIKSPTDATVYVVMPSDIRPISGWNALLALTPTGEPVITTVDAGIVASFAVGPVALTAGTLVRSPEDATVYLINGVTDRIAFSSFIFPREAGFNDFSFATQARLDAYPRASTNMTFGLVCGSDKFVAAGGSVHSVDAARVALYPFTYVPLDSFTCAQMKRGAAASDFIRTPDGSIYQLVAGQKRPISSFTRLRQLTATDNWLNVLPAFAAQIPTGPNA
ncbi:MAG: hypothetical protein R6W83_10250 [Cryobacterium sp.]